MQTRVVPVLLIALPLVLAGCASEAACQRITGVQWESAALFAAIEREASLVASGIPLQGAFVVNVSHHGPLEEGGGFWLDAFGLHWAGQSADDDAVAEGLDAFVAAVTDGGEVSAEYRAEFLASRNGSHDGWSMQAFWPSGIALQALHDRTVGPGENQHLREQGAWRWVYAFPTKSVVLGPASLEVDSLGLARVYHEWPPDTSAQQAHKDVQRWLEDQKLPAATSMGVLTTDC